MVKRSSKRRGDFVIAFHADHDEVQAVVLHLAIAAALGAEQFRAAHFEQVDVVSMMQIPHRIGFAVADPHRDVVALGKFIGHIFEISINGRSRILDEDRFAMIETRPHNAYSVGNGKIRNPNLEIRNKFE